MDLALRMAGAALVALALADVFFTVLYARAGAGVLTPRLNRWTWRALILVSGRRGHRRDKLLALGGPLMLVQTACLWFTLLVTGTALLVWPSMGEGVQAGQGATPTDFNAALYFAGYSLTTLGTGDLVPRTDFTRAVMVGAALVGFSVLTLTLTYFMSVYGALERRNALAQGLHHLSGASGDPLELLEHLAGDGRLPDRVGDLTAIGLGLLDLLESHHAYPVLHYFRWPDRRYALARIALLAIEPVTLMRSGVAGEPLSRAAPVVLMYSGATDLLKQTASALPGDDPDRDEPADEAEARVRFAAALSCLARFGIAPDRDHDEVLRRYRELSTPWRRRARAFANAMGHDWDEIEPSRTAHEGS
ncbi:hypothetical protein GCM10007067_21920 [Lysobacter bugurensis]|uniref:Potassium channel domain-containing protein n=2 Tax=Cognatilysobacter bugurensis TaxID=543356 RepID=A0A918WA14_9GAMM|nr:hypothetical protein GCM10007067_21920 [Lysobacter bugurensis]